MFLNITEDDIRMNCPEAAPMTLRAFNKISPRQFNSKVSVLNPYEIPRYAPTSSTQFAKSLLQQTPTASSPNIIVGDVQVTQLAKQVANTAGAQNFADNVGKDQDPGVEDLATKEDLAEDVVGRVMGTVGSTAPYAVAMGAIGATKLATGVAAGVAAVPEGVAQLGQGRREIDKAYEQGEEAGANALMGIVGGIANIIEGVKLDQGLTEDRKEMLGGFKGDEADRLDSQRPQ